jgi:hypothetical protein
MSTEEDQRDVDDQFRAILEGLRTTLPGVQVLFAFLLVLPLQASFAEIEDLSRFAYYVSFFGSALASILLIAPSAHQRLRAPITGVERRSITHLRLTVILTILGTVVFAIALAAAVLLISTLILSSAAAVAVTVAMTVVIGWSWFYIPLVTFQKT